MLILTDKQINLEIEKAEVINVNEKIINVCTGCYNCWTKTPGSCVIRDDQVLIYPKIAEASQLVFICRIRYGCYDVPFKAMLERCLPLQQPFLTIYEEETRHILRNVGRKDVIIIGYGADEEEEKKIFSYLVERNAKNMSFKRYKIIFASEGEVEEILQKEVSEKWDWKE